MRHALLPFFLNASLRLDEAQSIWQSSRSAGAILTLVAQDVHVPLYHELLHFWRYFGGDSVKGGRLLSLLFYLLAIPATYLLGTRAFDRRTGLFGATLLAISPFMNWYGNEIRMYTLLTLLVIINQYLFIRLWKDREASDHVWALYVLSAVAGIFTHYFFFLSLFAQAVFFFMRRALFPPYALRRFFVAALIVFVSFAPWVAFVFIQGQAQNASPVLHAPSTVDLFNALAQFIVGFQDDALNTVFLSLWPITLILGFLAMRKGRKMEPETEYLLLSSVLAVLLSFGVSLVLTPVFESRYLIFTLPAVYLLLGRFFALYPPYGRAVAQGVLVGAMAVMLCVELVNPKTPVKENYVEAASYLNDHVAAQDAVILSAPFTLYPVDYYYHGQSPLQTIPEWHRYAYGPIPSFNEHTLPQEVASTTWDHQYAYLLLSYDQGYEQKIKDYFDSHFKRTEAIRFSNDLNLYVYQLRYNTPVAQAAKTAYAQ